MTRRIFLTNIAVASAAPPFLTSLAAAAAQTNSSQTASPRDQPAHGWFALWKNYVIGQSKNRYCDSQNGEDLGWRVSPFLNGFYYAYLASGDSHWLQLLAEWTDSCLQRLVVEPDGFRGWPEGDGGGHPSTAYRADSLLGEAMLLRPVVLAAAEMTKTPALQTKWQDQARRYLQFAEETFKKWDSRSAWREVKQGGVWIVPPFGLDPGSGQWSSGYATRTTAGFSNPANKQNHIARWLLALHSVAGKPVYRDRAELWFRLMRSRIRTREDGKFFVWNYWDPAGPWDFNPDGSPRHWVGVHPNGGYYAIDVEGIVSAFEHDLVFTREDLARLVQTNRDFMWDGRLHPARFRRIDGGQADPRWKNSPGLLWPALVPYDQTLRAIFLENHQPASWSGLSLTPWFLAREKRKVL